MWSESLEIFNPAEDVFQTLLKEKKTLIAAMKIVQNRKGWSDEKTAKEIKRLWSK